MNAEQHLASIAIEITHSDEETRSLYFEQFQALKSLFENALHEKWNWEAVTTNNFGQPISQIIAALPNKSIYQQENWPELISFLKPRIIALDQFWSDVKPIFEAL